MRVPAERLPSDRRSRDDRLQEYLAEWVPATRRDGDDWLVSARAPPRAGYFVDPRLTEGLAFWRRLAGPTPVAQILLTHTTRSGVGLSLSDAWTLHTFAGTLARLPEGTPLVVLHVDDHEDLQAPRLAVLGASQTGLKDMFTGLKVGTRAPHEVDSAIRSGAIGMGSFLTPLIHEYDTQIRHLKPGPFRGRAPGRYTLERSQYADCLVPGVLRPSCRIGEPNVNGNYVLAVDTDAWLADLPDRAALLLHVDADAFNDRYDGDSDWRLHKRRHDPDADDVARMVDDVLAALSAVRGRLLASHIALSPAFFPAEHWEATASALVDGLGSPEPPVYLRAGKAGPGRERFWHVYEGDRRAGGVWLNARTTPEARATLTIQLNQASRGRGIGRVAYRLAADATDEPEVWLHMRRGNVASRRAAQHAGFVVVDDPSDAQLVMRWTPREARPRRSPPK